MDKRPSTSSRSFRWNRPRDWKVFEDLTEILVAEYLCDPNVLGHGRSGQRDLSVDIVGRNLASGSTRLIGFQCKDFGSTHLTRVMIDNLIADAEAFIPPLDEYIIVTTQERDAELQRYVLELSNARSRKGRLAVAVWFWEDYSLKLLDAYPEIAAAYLSSVGEGRRPKYLVADIASARRDFEENLHRTARTNILHYTIPLHARILPPQPDKGEPSRFSASEPVDACDACIHMLGRSDAAEGFPESKVARLLLVGPPASGKTTLLRQIEAQMTNHMD